MIQGKACLIGKEEEKWNENNNNRNNNSVLKEIHKVLYQKYPQYKVVGIWEYCIQIQPQKTITRRNDK
ncbi:MAG: hypothetical protein WKF36_06225 [Candidatus Nitrosocosmicus sp.]